MQKVLESGIAKDIAIFKFIEDSTKLDRGKGTKTQSVIKYIEVSTPKEHTKHKLESELAPKLIVISSDGEIVEAYIAADNKMSAFNLASNLHMTILSLLSVYYLAWIDYPRIYSHVLGFFQEFALGEKFIGVKSRNFIQFENSVKKLL